MDKNSNSQPIHDFPRIPPELRAARAAQNQMSSFSKPAPAIHNYPVIPQEMRQMRSLQTQMQRQLQSQMNEAQKRFEEMNKQSEERIARAIAEARSLSQQQLKTRYDCNIERVDEVADALKKGFIGGAISGAVTGNPYAILTRGATTMTGAGVAAFHLSESKWKKCIAEVEERKSVPKNNR